VIDITGGLGVSTAFLFFLQEVAIRATTATSITSVK
jgi:hypothetical protein